MIDPLIGQTFGQYELQDRLGRGGMAAVYRALQPTLGRAVAVKVLPLAQLPDPTLPERFRREARLAANLMHPNIVPVYDFGEWQGYLYIVMALIAGGTLKDRLQGPMPVELAVRLVSQVTDALGYAHGQGIFHRDVKPANILLSSGEWAMLSDFGIARALGETTRLTGPYGTIGTPAYMAPEQWLGGDVDGRADLYSLGIVLYEALAGSPPFTATTSQGLMRQHLEMPVPPLPAHRADVPAAFDDVLQTALAKEPDLRYRHAGELKAALEAAMQRGQAPHSISRTDLAVSLGPATTSPHLGQTLRVPRLPVAAPAADPPRRAGGAPTILIALLLVLVMLLAGAVGYILAGGRGGVSSAPSATPTTVVAAAPPTGQPAPQPAAPIQTPAPAAAVAKVATAAPAPTAPPPPTATQPGSPATPTVRPAAVQPTAPPKTVPTATSAPDQRLALIERHVGDYFAALTAGDYARAQAVCCTPSWRSRYPLDDWRKNFAGVTDLRFATPFRYTTMEPDRVVAEVDYSFASSGGARRFFTLRWTFVPVGSDWLADDAVAFPQR